MMAKQRPYRDQIDGLSMESAPGEIIPRSDDLYNQMSYADMRRTGEDRPLPALVNKSLDSKSIFELE